MNSTFDMANGYYQIKVHPESVEKTASVTSMGKYNFFGEGSSCLPEIDEHSTSSNDRIHYILH